VLELNVEPTSAVPLIVGLAVFTGARPPASATMFVGAAVADALPPLLDAVTTTSTVWPPSPAPSVYLPLVAAEMFAQLAPEASQSCH
jgi:hypothetical protein